MFQNTVTFVLTILHSPSLFIDRVPQLACECIKVTSVARNMICHEFFQKNLSSASVVIFDTSETLSLTWGLASLRNIYQFAFHISLKFSDLHISWILRLPIQADFQFYTFVFLRDVPFLVLCITWHTRVICPTLRPYNPCFCLTEVPFDASIILNSGVNIQMMLSWLLKSLGIPRQFKFPTHWSYT